MFAPTPREVQGGKENVMVYTNHILKVGAVNNGAGRPRGLDAWRKFWQASVAVGTEELRLDPNQRSIESRDFEAGLRQKIVGQDEALQAVVDLYQVG